MRYLIFYFLVTAHCALAQVSRRMDEVVNTFVLRQQFTGTVLVARDNKIVHHKGYGQAHRSFTVPATTDTRYPIGDITQCFTAVLVLQLVQDKRLQLSTRVADVLREYQGFDIGRLTVQQLLHQSTGLADFAETSSYQRRQREVLAPPQLIEMVKYTQLAFKPGTAYHYSRSNYLLLGMLLERITGMQYAQLLQERILAPCGMNSSGMHSATEVLPSLAQGYVRTAGRVAHPPYTDPSAGHAQAGIYSTAQDLFQFCFTLSMGSLLNDSARAALMRPDLAGFAGGWYGRRITTAQMADALLPAPYTTAAAGGPVVYWAAGQQPGYTTLLVHIPDDGLVVALLCNLQHTDGSTPTHLAALAAQLIALL